MLQKVGCAAAVLSHEPLTSRMRVISVALPAVPANVRLAARAICAASLHIEKQCPELGRLLTASF